MIAEKLEYLNKNQEALNFLKDVNEVTTNFFLSQQRNQKHHPKGRRFTLDDKILALSIYKQSGKGYRFLSNLFSLPSRKSLTEMLNRIPVRRGYNESVFQHIRNRVKHLPPINRLCVLMFDEVSLEAGLMYNTRFDVIDGFVDVGEGQRRCRFADHSFSVYAEGYN